MPDPNQGIVVDDVHDDARLALEEVKKAQEAEPAPVQEPTPPPAEVKEPAEPKPVEDRPRGPDGKFVKKEGEPEPAKEVVKSPEAGNVEIAPVAGAVAGKATVGDVGAAPIQAGPPPGWSVAAKTEWDKLSPAVREAIAKRETEVSTGFKQYEGLRPWNERAQKSGQSLPQVLEKFAAFEDACRRDLGTGFAKIAEHQGMSQHQFGAMCLQLAQKYGAVQNGQPTYEPAANGAAPQFDPNAILPQFQSLLDQRLRPLEQTLQSQITAGQAHQTRAVETVVERFRSDPAHRYFDNVEDTIAQLFESGIVPRTGDHNADLTKAYDIACWQNPEIRAALINEQTAKTEADRKQREQAVAEKARAASKSITGASLPAAVTPLPGEDDVQAAARAAYRQHSM